MHILKKSVPATLLLLSLPVILFAAETAPAASSGDKETLSFNPVLTGLVTLIIVLLMAIGLIANVLRQLVYVYREKLRADRRASNANITAAILFLICMLPAFGALAADEAPAAPSGPVYISGIPQTDFYVLVGIIGLEILVILSMLMNIRLLVKLLKARPETEQIAKAIVRRSFWERFNKSVEIAKENDILLDHDYDGIRELDNNLPPWWKYGFYATIVVGVIYLWYYHVGNGPGQIAEYTTDVEQGKQEVAEYLAKSANNVDENTVQLITDKSQLGGAENIFQTTCAACHAKDGGGGIGPNLTDAYWLHGGSIQDVFKSIKYGWQDKGMKSWKDDFPPKQIAELASYVKSLQGTHPAAPKPPQGALYKDAVAAASGTDSTKSNTGAAAPVLK
jgi:cytochrome c oxidase cbb3-type subunit 3